MSGSTWDDLVEQDEFDEYLERQFLRQQDWIPIRSTYLILFSLLLATAKKCGPRVSRIVVAGRRGWRSRNRQEAATFTTAFMRLSAPSCSLKRRPTAWCPNGKVAIRQDAKWSVPEPELALLISSTAKILGYTIGNDMSARDIEGENPLYLPQAKVYNRSCALGPCILVSSSPLPRSTTIRLDILRQTSTAFTGSTTLQELKREPAQLVDYLYRENSFPHGCLLLTGTGIVPPDSFTLNRGDEIRIAIEGIGNLINFVE